jgi:predicted nucleic acid-binding protein
VILLDTNVISEWMRPSPDPAVIAWLDRQRASRLFVSAVTRAEIETGIALLPDGRRRERLRRAAEVVFAALEGRCLPFDCAVAPVYADILAHSRRVGRPVSVEDAQIAAVACGKRLGLATRNSADLDFLDDLELINPWDGP